MKKFLTAALAIMAVIAQAQTCKISADKNNGKIIQISVNLDSLQGRTLVTTINNSAKDSLTLTMAFSDVDTCVLGQTVIENREDSSDIANNEIEDANVDSTAIESPTLAESEVAQPTLTGSILETVGLSEVAGLLNSLTHTNGKSYAEYSDELIKSVTVADTTKYIPSYKKRKWKWLSNYNPYFTVKLSGIFGKDFGGEDNDGYEDIDEADYGTDPENGYNIGGSAEGSLVFIKGHWDENGKFIPNHLNFGWSIGALFAMDKQRDCGWSWDILAKVGIQAGNGITLGADVLFGGGSTPYTIYSTNYIDHRTILHHQLCIKYGVQGWISMNYAGNTYTALFARFVTSVAPNSVYNHPTAKGWENKFIDFDKGSWQIGMAVGYKFGYHADIVNRRLTATLSVGQNLFGNEKSVETLIELERFNNVNPKLDFVYGFGYGASFDVNRLQNLTLGIGWKYRPSASGKFSCLAKIYAGAGEYMVEKCVEDVDNFFSMENTAIKQLCVKGGLQLGVGYQIGSLNLNAKLRGGYHFGFDTEYTGYSVTETKNLKGFELTPMLGVSINF